MNIPALIYVVYKKLNNLLNNDLVPAPLQVKKNV